MSEVIIIVDKVVDIQNLANMSAKDADTIFEADDSSKIKNAARKRGRKPKSNCVPNQAANCDPRRTTRCQITGKKIETESKKLKLFPIFNSPQRNNEFPDKSTEVFPVKQQKGEVLKADKSTENKQKNLHKTNKKKFKKNAPAKNSKAFFGGDAENTDRPECVIIDQERTSLEILEMGGFKDSFHNDIDSAVSETVENMCLKTEQNVDSDDITVLNSVDQSAEVKSSCAIKQESNKLKRKRKSKSIASLRAHLPSNDNFDDKSVSDVSSRRRSLRSGGVRNNLINYSEANSCVAISDQKKDHKLEVSNCTVVKYDNSNLISEGYSSNAKRKSSLKAVKKSENVKENIKLFPIFSSKKIIPEEANANHSSTKRKTLSDEIDPENEDIAGDEPDKSKPKHSLRKRVKNKSYVEESDEECEVIENNLNASSTSSKTQIEKCEILKDLPVSDTTECKDKHAIESKESAKVSQPDVLKVHKKPHVELFCFPLISHLKISNELLPETVKTFSINSEDSEVDMTIPVYSELQSFIDEDSIKMIKSKGNYFETRKVSVKDLTSASPDETGGNSENMLWTDSIQNTIIKEKKNEVLVKEVKSWLLQWKDKFCKKSEKENSRSDSDSFTSDSEDDDFASNSIIIYGAPGSGKTNLVFSLANELGFTVLEVNASSHRNGRNISHQLKEALESYHVESIKIENPFELAALEMKKDIKKKKHASDRKESNVSSKKNIKTFFTLENKNQPKSNEKIKNAANFFQTSISNQKNMKSKQNGKNKKVVNSQQEESEGTKNSAVNTIDIKSDKNLCTISNLTIILFDDVDIVFEEDEGFWSTVKGFLKISKKPVIFTVGRNLSIVKTMLNADIRIFDMKPTSKDFTLNTLKEHCKKHSRGNTNTDLELLSSHCHADLRRNILNAQFWTQNAANIKEENFENGNKFVHVNSFIVGDLNFSADQIRKLLFHPVPNYFLNAVSQYQNVGYDVLYTNLFYILNILDSLKWEKEWLTLSSLKSDSDVKHFSDSQMWEEACEIFKRKKNALKNGSCSKELDSFADAVSDFSFADMLKGLSSNKFQWISVSERMKFWTAGLPICCDHSSLSREDILEYVSLINIYALRKVQRTDCFKSEMCNNNDLILEHPFMLFDDAYAHQTESDVESLSTALPVFHQLNKNALTLDYLSMIKIMCQNEETRQLNSGKRSGRFLHYFDSISFYIDRKTF